jgi:hypothetical protein
VHQADQQRAPAKAVGVRVRVLRIGAVSLRWPWAGDGRCRRHGNGEMHAVASHPPQHMRAEANQHHTDRRLQRPRQRFPNGVTKQDRSSCKGKQRQRAAEPPGQTVLDDVEHLAAARGDRGNRRDMIGLQRMLYAEQKPKA